VSFRDLQGNLDYYPFPREEMYSDSIKISVLANLKAPPNPSAHTGYCFSFSWLFL
jgi:hypothetical protein